MIKFDLFLYTWLWLFKQTRIRTGLDISESCICPAAIEFASVSSQLMKSYCYQQYI